MTNQKENDYGELCATLYEILHPTAEKEEYDFYRSFFSFQDRILEPMCGSGRFLIPLRQEGYRVEGIDASPAMIAALKKKDPDAVARQGDLLRETIPPVYDAIFVPAGSFSLFTREEDARLALSRFYGGLRPGGRLLFAAESLAGREEEDQEEREAVSIPLPGGRVLTLKGKRHFDEERSVQCLPGHYLLRQGGETKKEEWMDFRVRLYRLEELKALLGETAFEETRIYASFAKAEARNDDDPFFLVDCRKPR